MAHKYFVLQPALTCSLWTAILNVLPLFSFCKLELFKLIGIVNFLVCCFNQCPLDAFAFFLMTGSLTNYSIISDLQCVQGLILASRWCHGMKLLGKRSSYTRIEKPLLTKVGEELRKFQLAGHSVCPCPLLRVNIDRRFTVHLMFSKL